MDENSIVKIGDFGSSRIMPETINNNLTPMIGTKWYKAPEVLFGSKNYDKSVDIWSFGCIITELFLLEPIFPGNTDFEMINYIFDFLGYTIEDNDVTKTLSRFSSLNLNSISKHRNQTYLKTDLTIPIVLL